MKRIVVVFVVFLSLALQAQEVKRLEVEFLVVEQESAEPLVDVVVIEDSLKLQVKTNHKGIARLRLPINSNYRLHFYKDSYKTLKTKISLGELPLEQLRVELEVDPIAQELSSLFNANLESFFDGVDDSQSAYLTVGRTVFDRKAAFDWGSSFFNRRGLRSSYRKILLNSIELNRLSNNRALWGQWGGLNDFFRNQQNTQALMPSSNTPSRGLGVTSFELSPNAMRKGKRWSSSLSDKSYQGRLLFSVVENLSDRFRIALGGSVRLGKRGYKQGTPYQASSYALFMEQKWNEQSSTSLHLFKSTQHTGKSSALSEEVVELLGSDYNPNWGYNKKDIRSAKLKKLNFKTAILSHRWTNEKRLLGLNVLAQEGSTACTRMYYDTAESPHPIYYKKLPSYYINGFLGANFYAANSAERSLLSNSQINWEQLYTANTLHPSYAHYAVVADIEQQQRWAGSLVYQNDLTKGLFLSGNASFNMEFYQNYTGIEDLLGGTYIRNFNSFDGSLHDLNGPLLKGDKDQIQYSYDTKGIEFKVYSQLKYQTNKWLFILGIEQKQLSYERERLMINERFAETPRILRNRFKGTHLNFNSRYAFDARNYIEFNRIHYKKPVSMDRFFVNPRENNRILEQDHHYEYARLTDLSYIMRWRKLEGRISAYLYEFDHQSQNASYYVHTTYGPVFVQSLLTDLATIHKGIEGGFKLKLSPVVSLEGALAIGAFSYVNNPQMSLEVANDIGLEGVVLSQNRLDLGETKLQGYRLGNGPQQAYSLSLTYRDPSYWFSSLSLNRISNTYIAPAPIRFTDSFYLDKDNLKPANLLPHERVLLATQEVLEPYFITNLLFGKSYLKNGIYASVFLSVDNLLATDFRSGGYESSRYGNYRDYLDDQLSTTPLFPTKYWWSSSRRFFLNLTISLP